MAATEDVACMLDGMGIRTGVDVDKLIEAEWKLSEMIGRPTMSHVAKAGPRPGSDRLYDPNMPFVETHAQARHFVVGASAYSGGICPWRTPIPGPPLTREGSSES
jgi:hydroxymethylglutaryl-CoA lyase